MKKIYLYMHHCGFDFYLSDYEISYSERYCTDCKEACKLLGTYESEEALAEKIKDLLERGFDPIACDIYTKISNKYKFPERKYIKSTTAKS